jgi:hypothetical protein
MMVVVMGLGLCLLLRPGKLSFILSLIMYGVFLVMYVITEPVELVGLLLFCGPLILLFLGGVLYAQRAVTGR